MDLKNKFENAVEQVKQLSSRPSNEDLLELYALYKQATVGDATGSRPAIFDIKGRKKFDSWTGKKGLSPKQAMTNYCELVERLLKSDHT